MASCLEWAVFAVSDSDLGLACFLGLKQDKHRDMIHNLSQLLIVLVSINL
jgi:hypothetical protein